MALVIFINIPIAVIAIILAFITFHFSEESEVKSSSLDVKGLSFFYIFIGLFMFGLLSKSSIVLNIIALMLAFIFIFILFKFESKIKNPFIPISEFNRSVSLVFVTDLLIAMSLMGYNLYIPIYLQDHLHLSPLQSGLVIFPLSVAWLVLNFNLAKVEENLTRKALYISAFTLLLISSIILMFGLKVPLLIATTVILPGKFWICLYKGQCHRSRRNRS